MSRKILYTLLVLSGAFFSIAFFSADNVTPEFTHAYAKSVKHTQVDIFDYSKIKNTTEKKQIFFNTLRPIIENQNQIIRDNRQRALFSKQHNTDHEWLASIAEKYNVEWDNTQPDWKALLTHLDTIPVELVMTQAANESAWGTSRFAQQGNNLFGQWCFKKGCGIVPGQRDNGSNHEVKKFNSINDSVASYMHNINTTKAYKELRQLRAQLREQGKPVDALSLATGLSRYSSRGQAYVNEIQSMIKTNIALMQGLNKKS